LAGLKELPQEERKIEEIPVVQEFSDVFPEDFSGLSLDREIEFCIDLIPRVAQYLKHPTGWHQCN
jgi:hypothetical protein